MTTQTERRHQLTGSMARIFAQTLDAIAEAGGSDAGDKMREVMRTIDAYGPDAMKRVAIEGKRLKRTPQPADTAIVGDVDTDPFPYAVVVDGVVVECVSHMQVADDIAWKYSHPGPSRTVYDVTEADEIINA